MRYAVIDNGIVTNIVEWDGEGTWQPPEGTTAAEAHGGVRIGWQHDGQAFADPNPPPEPPPVTTITRDQAMLQLDADGKLDAAFAMAQQAGGLVYQRWFNPRWERSDFDGPPLSTMAAALEIDVDAFFAAAAVRAA